MKSPAAIRKQIAKLQAQIAATEKSREKALRKIIADMQKHDLSLTDLRDAMGAKPKRAVRKKTTGSVPVKFRDDKGNTWSGRGREPKWMTEAIAQGRKRSDFAI
jgi:DNA-binding protein H-NS